MRTKTELKNAGVEMREKPANRLTGQQANRTGQALIELAVFGVIFLMILGMFISYGLKFNYNQLAQMTAFRRALKIASDPNKGSGTYMLIQDRHIPDPTGMFGIGTTMPIIASASVTRDPNMDAQAVDASSLSSTVIDVESGNIGAGARDVRRIVYPNAGFRIEKRDLTEDQAKAVLPKYQQIYGAAKYVAGATTTGPFGVPITLYDIRVIDACLSPVADYETCYGQAVNLVDEEACVRDCHNNFGKDCATTCAHVLNPPNQNTNTYNPAIGGPWYAANYVRHSADADHLYTWYEFPVLEKLFDFAQTHKIMGFQQSDTTTTRSEQASSLHKMETTSQIVTEETVTWSEKQPRLFVYQENIGANGYEIPRATAMEYAEHVSNEYVNSEFTGDIRKTWITEK